MTRNKKGDGARKGRKGRRRGCARCGNMKYSSGKWCPCNGFRADGTPIKSGQSRVEEYGKGDQEKFMENGTRYNGIKSTESIDAKKNYDMNKTDATDDLTKYGECYKCGCSRHVDEVGDRICWCDECLTSTEYGECYMCGCSRHVDEVGDRICWCDECDSLDWESLWKPKWNRTLLDLADEQDTGSQTECIIVKL